MASLFVSGRFQLVGGELGTLETYAAGTLTPLATYTTQAGDVPNPTTINLDANGRAAVWLGSSSYRVIGKSALGLTIYDEDNISAGVSEIVADLASSASGKGDALIAVKRAATGSVATTQHEVNARTLCVFDFMTAAQIADVQSGAMALDVTTAVQAALTHAASQARGHIAMPTGVNAVFTGMRVYMPEGVYRCDLASLRMAGGCGLVGAGKYLTVIRSAYDGMILRLDPVTLSYGTDATLISNLAIIGDRTKASQDGLCMLRTGDGLVSNVFILNCGRDNLVIRQGLATVFDGVVSYAAKGCTLRIMDGIETWDGGVANNYPTNHLHFFGCHFGFSDGPALRMDGTGDGSLGTVNGCNFKSCTFEYGYVSGPAGTGQQVEDFSNSYFPNQFDGCWFETNATGSKYHILKTGLNISASMRLTNCFHTGNGPSSYPERFVNVTVGTVVDDGSSATGNSYRTVGGSNAPYRLTKATARIELLNVNGAGLPPEGPWVEDETNATTGLVSNARISVYNAIRGPFAHYADPSDFGLSQYRVGDAHAFFRLVGDRSVRVGNGTSAAVPALINNYLGVSADRGDTSQTLTAGVDMMTQRWATALTTGRTVTLSATGAQAGHKFRIVRTASGGSSLDVGGLKSLPASSWCEVEHDGTAWRLTGYGTL